MKKLVVLGVTIGAGMLAAVFVLRSLSPQETAAEPRELSKRNADVLQTKIDDIKKADEAGDSSRQPSETEVSEAELESYVVYSLREQIPVQIDSIDVQLTSGAVASDTQLTFNSNTTGNPMVDALVGGTHNLFVKGRLHGYQGRGKFELEEVKVDGIPVPKVLIQTLFDKYVKPKYPEADLKEPFDMPWGIDSIDIQTQKARIVY
jgi:hypothetical protein